MAAGPSRYMFSTAEGHVLTRSILRKHIPYDPHDYQLEGVCQVLDGVDLLAALATGSGKTGFYSMYMLMLTELSNNQSLCNPPYHSVPKDPAMVGIYPTIGLEEQMAEEFTKIGLSSLVINSRTLEAARASSTNLWVRARAGVTMLLLSPEQLASKGFESLLQNPTFRNRVCAVGLDEAHALDTWGASFRKSYRQIGFIRARMPDRVRIIAASATIRVDGPKENICKLLGFRAGEYYELRRSNVRRNVRPIFRVLQSGLGGWAFPDLDWIIPDGRKTVIFCRTIALGYRVLVYLWSKIPNGADCTRFLRLYNALNWTTYNTETRELMRCDESCKIIIATATFMMGVDVPNIFRVLLLGDPESTEEWLQWLGRAQRDVKLTDDGECITYITKGAISNARGIIDGTLSHGASRKKTKSSSDKNAVMDKAMARVLLAPCKIAEQDMLYANPPSDPPCLCETCTARSARQPLRSETPWPCNCSGPGELGCQPEAIVAPVARKSKTDNPVPKAKRLTKAMRAVGMDRFIHFRNKIYLADTSAAADLFPPEVFFPEPTMKAILDRFALIATPGELQDLIAKRTYLLPHSEGLWSVIVELQIAFVTMRGKPSASKSKETESDIPGSDVGGNGATVANEATAEEDHGDGFENASMMLEWDLGVRQ
ncbi:P-loop containing nucleoside triphosphate hydrolase protein [Fomitopsis serialis]|uniref:P-loop containing nucleoside triphosphate hydrolase protein n=1 Tax=Fomitopsis serialis TaxID=139415 RepID=UPI002008EB0A|nr:P-loop containing nucleoside triphosphate hydrolase protein [Neoantrodia serialis]KAH9934137.1 P-loop containing nucleoside triphosphate hydrolase protein [Neoantrodia serialis]